ncbi:SUMF1/EgtB/PvdO family nonheme iron enzyme [Draconibacterium sp.]|nr:SUMF1/EgtB/PvdO family nonheme iron enzyme [Draconibacterium sp.]
MQPLKIISDNTDNRDEIAFGFKAYANAIAELIATKSNKTPFTIGISGRWGSGKTTLMKQVEKLLKDIPENDNNFRKIKTVWFQAWKYKDEDEILAALLNDIFEKFKNEQGKLQSIKGEVIKQAKELPKSLNYRKIFSMLSKAAINIDITEFFKDVKADDPVYKEFLGFYDNFEKEFDDILWELLGTEKDDRNAALVVFIDDLDRCPLPKIIQILETVKVFMDREGCIFVIGAAKDIIQKALKNEEKYQDEDAEKFLEKIVQVEFPLPKKTKENSDNFIGEIKEKLGITDDISDEDIELILKVLDFNPRRIIALFNRISLQQSIMRRGENTIDIDFRKVLFWRVLDLYKGVFFNLIRRDEKFFKKYKADSKAYSKFTDEEKKDTEKIKRTVEDNLVWLEDEDIQTLFTKMDLTDNEYKQLVSYSKTLQTEESELKEEQEIREYCEEMERKYPEGRDDDKKFIPIQGGEYVLDGLGQRDLPDFQISKYPVTNKWYQEFIDDNGYANEKYWSKDGLFWLKENNYKRSEKGAAYDNPFQHPAQPVVRISWFEAQAFCRWLSEKEKGTYRLPSESEWQAAAAGKNKRIYAWGNEWNHSYCNVKDGKIGKTSIVGIFNNGNTPEGVSDMIGNVWEWCGDKSSDNLQDAPKDGQAFENIRGILRVRRGGSYDNRKDVCTSTFRSHDTPDRQHYNMGFRLVFVP